MVESVLTVPVSAPAAAPPAASAQRTIWGLNPMQLYARYWASMGVQVVRQGERSEIVSHAELFLLNDPRSFTLFEMSDFMQTLNWIKPSALFVRLYDSHERGYRERIHTDALDNFVSFERLYDASWRLTRLVITPDRDIAQLWQNSINPAAGWRRLRRYIRKPERAVKAVHGNVYDRENAREVALFLRDLIGKWNRPDSTISRAISDDGQVWRDPQARIGPGIKFIGRVWVGAGRELSPQTTLVGPAVVWDDPAHRPVVEDISWQEIEPTEPPEESVPVPSGTRAYNFSKRAFDIFFALLAMTLSSPLYPLILLAIWIEDRGHPFFGHVRETRGGETFRCWKFRSMRLDAEQIKEQLVRQNQADGPQFYMEKDPRLTKVGKFLRKYNLDELPQFWCVLVGDMSVVGPRPSPKKENQCCPSWREARLSVRPGITGLWQIKRTRRTGTDFQEWIKWDIEYVQQRSFWLDLTIIFKTVSAIFGKVSRS